jgi:hypothetical protein
MLNVKELDKATELLERKYQKELLKQFQEAKNSIEKELSLAYMKFGNGDVLTMAEMAKYDRLQKLINEVNKDIATLNRGMTAQTRGYLTDTYMTNYYNYVNLIEKGNNIGFGFGQLNRKAIYQSVLSPMDLIALENNAVAVRQGIKRAITQGIVQGNGARETSKLVAKALEKNGNDALRIVRTETTGIMNKARLDATEKVQSAGIKMIKVWVSTNDGRTRDRHKPKSEGGVGGEERAIDKPFSNGLMYPGDQSGPAKEVVNCRCSYSTITVEVPEKYKDKDPTEIPKEYRI